MTHTDVNQFFRVFYAEFLKEEDVPRLKAGAHIFYFYHFGHKRVMAFTKKEFRGQTRDYKRGGFVYLEDYEDPVIHLMRIKDTMYVVKYHRFQPENKSCRLPASFDPLPAAMTGYIISPYVIAETFLLKEGEPTPSNCEIEVDRTDLVHPSLMKTLSHTPAITPLNVTPLNVTPPAMVTRVPAVVPSPTVDTEKWQIGSSAGKIFFSVCCFLFLLLIVLSMWSG